MKCDAHPVGVVGARPSSGNCGDIHSKERSARVIRLSQALANTIAPSAMIEARREAL